ncbi:MAG: hypothetical protein L0027_03175 [Candidatus Rokubacteria bacterium]|nr:hypothetical protein [Candidatus Rokubacteria bacterium]
MRRARSVARRSGLMVAVGLAALGGTFLGGCASSGSPPGNLLTQAGFQVIPADTPARAAHLRTLPPGKLVARSHDGTTYYVYADPEGCKCLYVGNADAYAAYRRLGKKLETDAAREVLEWEQSGLIL